MWFITFIVLALAAILIIKAVKAQADRKAANEAQLSQGDGLHGQLNREASSQTVSEQNAAANDSGQQQSDIVEDATERTAQAPEPDEARRAESREIQEMIKILNLTEADSARLGINAEQFSALRGDDSSPARPSAEKQADIADRLRRMLA